MKHKFIWWNGKPKKKRKSTPQTKEYMHHYYATVLKEKRKGQYEIRKE